jgi:Kelch motif protein
VYPAAAAQEATGAQVRYRGLEEQNQPVRLVYDKAAERVQFRIGYIAHCVGTGGENEGEEAPSAPHVAKPPNGARVEVASDGTFTERFRFRVDRVNRRGADLRTEIHRRMRIRVGGRLSADDRARGTIRVRYTEVRLEHNYDVDLRYESSCDSDVRIWRTPRFRFTGPWRPTGPIPLAAPDVLLSLQDGQLLTLGAKVAEDFAPPRAATYLPMRDRWRRTQPPMERHHEAVAVVLSDGRVLVAGGWSDTVRDDTIDNRTLRAAEIYNPRSDRWTPVARLTRRRVGARAELLPDGRVLIVGGTQGRSATRATASAEIFDPTSERFRGTAWLPQALAALRSAVLPSGKILLTGLAEDGSARAEIFDPSSDTWSPLELPPDLEYVTSLTELEDGRVLATATSFSEESRSPVAAVFTEGAGWASASPPPAFASGGDSVLLPSGRVLVPMSELEPGVFDSHRAAIFDPETDIWEYAAPYFHPYTQYPHLAPMPSGALLITDGPTAYTRTERFVEE